MLTSAALMALAAAFRQAHAAESSLNLRKSLCDVLWRCSSEQLLVTFTGPEDGLV